MLFRDHKTSHGGQYGRGSFGKGAMNVVNAFRLESARNLERFKSLENQGLRDRVQLLEQEDKILVELSADLRASHRQIAQLMQLGVGTVSRRLRRIGAPIHSPLVARLLDSSTCPLGPNYRQIGVQHFLTGKTFARIAAENGTSVAFVREAIAAVRAWHRHTWAGARGVGTK